MSASIQLAGVRVGRVGYGTMRLTGPGVLGPPADLDEARRVLRRALELGVRVFDTAWYYGPDIANRLLAEATRSFPGELVIATKLGWEYDDAGRLVSAHTREQLRAAMQRDLRLLGSDAIAIVHLRWGDDRGLSEAFVSALDAMIEMRDEGRFGGVGLSNVGPAQLDYALARTRIASVSNSFSVADQRDSRIVELTARHGIAYLRWLPLRTGSARQVRTLGGWADKLGATAAQVALAWLLQRAPSIVLIPGTSSVRHLEENIAAQALHLPDDAMRELTGSER